MCNLDLDCADIQIALASFNVKSLSRYLTRNLERSLRSGICRMEEKHFSISE